MYAWEADGCYPLGHGSCILATLLLKKDVGNRCIQLRYTGVQAECLHMLFSQPFPATNFRMLAATPTVRQDAGGFCPVLSTPRKACLEASCQLAAYLWQGQGSSILRQEVPRLQSSAPGDTLQVCIVNLRLRSLWQTSLVKTCETHSAGSVEL